MNPLTILINALVPVLVTKAEEIIAKPKRKKRGKEKHAFVSDIVTASVLAAAKDIPGASVQLHELHNMIDASINKTLKEIA